MEVYLDCTPTDQAGHEIESLLSVGRDRQRYQHVGVKTYADLGAIGANHCGLELTDHQATNVRLNPLGVIKLALPTHLLVRLYLIARLKSLLLLHQIQVLLQTVDQVTYQLLRILLSVP